MYADVQIYIYTYVMCAYVYGERKTEAVRHRQNLNNVKSSKKLKT